MCKKTYYFVQNFCSLSIYFIHKCYHRYSEVSYYNCLNDTIAVICFGFVVQCRQIDIQPRFKLAAGRNSSPGSLCV